MLEDSSKQTGHKAGRSGMEGGGERGLERGAGKFLSTSRRFRPAAMNREAGYPFRERSRRVRRAGEDGVEGEGGRGRRKKGLSTLPLLYTLQRAYVPDESTRLALIPLPVPLPRSRSLCLARARTRAVSL